MNKLPYVVCQKLLAYTDSDVIEEKLKKIKFFNSLLYELREDNITQNRRVAILNGDPFMSNIEYNEYDNQVIEEILTKYLDDEWTSKFLIELLKCHSYPFVIGGSFITNIMQLLNNKKFNKEQYKDSDIDIYCVSSQYNTKYIHFYIEEKLKEVLAKFLPERKCYIYNTKIIINIVPEIGRKIQIICHQKKTMEEHMEFIDLPITKFVLQKSNGGYKIFHTQSAIYALEKKINIINDPLNALVANRIVKYQQRGFLTVIMSEYNRVIGICDIQGKRMIRYNVDTTLKYIESVFNEILEKYDSLVSIQFDQKIIEKGIQKINSIEQLGLQNNLSSQPKMFLWLCGLEIIKYKKLKSTIIYDRILVSRGSYASYYRYIVRNIVDIKKKDGEYRELKHVYQLNENHMDYNTLNSLYFKSNFHLFQLTRFTRENLYNNLDFLKNLEILNLLFTKPTIYFLMNNGCYLHKDGRFHCTKENTISKPEIIKYLNAQYGITEKDSV
jgi:hypothetical protein